MNNPEYVIVENTKYKINTDFRVAIQCQEIATDETIGDYERALAIIYKIYGDDGLNNTNHQEKLLELAQKFLSCGKEIESSEDKEQDMDFIQDMDYIKASFMSDYHIDLNNSNMHWWEFYNLINGLSNSELGNCCVLNRIRNLRNYDTSQIKDQKEKQKIIEAQKSVALKKKEIVKELTEEQQESVDKFYELTGFKRRD